MGLVPQCKGELAIQVGYQVCAPLLVGVDKYFRIAVGGEAVPPRLKLGAQSRVVEDLSVLGHPHAAVLVAQGLVAAGEIDDGEAARARAMWSSK